MKNILVVEDNERWQNRIAEILSTKNYNPICVSSLDHAKRTLDESQIDLAVVDINLTDFVGNQDGIKFIEHLENSAKHLPIIVVTGSLPSDSESLKNRVFGFFTKKPPFDPKVFLNTVDQAFQSNKL